jgi:hypothetical protein
MTAQGDLPQRPTHPHLGTRRSGEFERGAMQAHRANASDHNFAQTYPANPAMSSAPAETHHSRRPSFDNSRSKDEQVILVTDLLELMFSHCCSCFLSIMSS